MLFLIILIISCVSVLAINNPAARYCTEEGNSYELKVDKAGNEYGVCTTNEGEKDEWDFYSNKIKIEKVNPSFMNVAKSDKSKISLLPNKMGINSQNKDQMIPLRGSHPSTFDWRNNNGDWLTPIRNQGGCGSCWAFSAVGVSEAGVNINLDDSDFNIDLSEQDLVSCSSAGDCDGGNEGPALEYIKTTGIVKESCFGYTQSNNVCSNKCSDNELVKLDYHSISPTADAIKEAISNEGPVTVYMLACSDFNSYSGGIYTTPSLFGCGWHALSIVGYSDPGQYWIGRNSWGSSWGENGYFRMAYSESIYDSNTWWNDPNDYRVFFLDDSYVVTSTDIDNDGVSDATDNCAEVSNSNQADADSNGVGDVCDCLSNWVAEENNCSISDNKIISYTDTNSCGKAYGLPADNGTLTSCDYCTPNWVEVNTICQPDDSGTNYYNDSNGCYYQTGLESDNNPPENKTSPCNYFKDLVITEIMYNPSGSDANREWIEIYNKDNFEINLADLIFYEQNTKHGISVIQGNYLLGVEEYAILANDDSSFMTDYPNYNKTLLDSSFSLLNSGEYLALYDHETLLDTY